MLNRELEVTLNLAFKEARAKRHEFMTVEHLLLALLDNPSASEVLLAYGLRARDARLPAISLRGMAKIMPPSAAILIQPLSATSPSVGSINAPLPKRERAGSTPQPTTKAPVAPRALSNQVRRFMLQLRLRSLFPRRGE